MDQSWGGLKGNARGTPREVTRYNWVERDETERNVMERDGKERNGTGRDGIERNGTGRNGIELNGTEPNGTERNRTERNGTWWNGMERDRTEFNGMERYGKELNGMERDGERDGTHKNMWFPKRVDRLEPTWTELNWIRLNCTELPAELNLLNCASIYALFHGGVWKKKCRMKTINILRISMFIFFIAVTYTWDKKKKIFPENYNVNRQYELNV